MKIEQVICQVLRVPSVEEKTASSQDAVVVRIRTDTGLEGVGEGTKAEHVSSGRVASNRGCPGETMDR